MAEQAITQEELFLPLVQFISDHGGEIDRRRDNLLDALADRLGLTPEEREGTTEGGREQWRSTVEWSREKLIQLYGAIERGPTGIWRLSPDGRRLVENPPREWIDEFNNWQKKRRDLRPADAPPPPERPSGTFEQRLEQMAESLEVAVHAALRVKRNAALAKALKEEYGYRCQLCDPTDPECPRIPTVNGRHYVEVHHIDGLAEVAARAEHGQLDDSEYQNLTSYHNVIVVCAYHHRLLHHSREAYEFDRESLCFIAEDGSDVLVLFVHEPHLEG